MKKGQILDRRNLSKEGKEIIKDRVRNFPRYTIFSQQQLSSSSFLAKNFPWGCKMMDSIPQFNQNDILAFAYHRDFSNIIIGVKYGICCLQRAAQFSFISSKLKNKPPNSSLYLKFIDKQYQDKVFALGKVIQINPGLNFRFWHSLRENSSPVGLVVINYIAVGYGNNSQDLGQLYNSLRSTSIPYNYFKVADDYEEKQRRKYINMIMNGEIEQFEQKLEQRSRLMLENLKEKEEMDDQFEL